MLWLLSILHSFSHSDFKIYRKFYTYSISHFVKNIYFIYLTVPGLSSMQSLRQDLVPQPGLESEPPALGVWNLSHWIPREVPHPSQLWSIFNFKFFQWKDSHTKFVLEYWMIILWYFLNILWIVVLDFFSPNLFIKDVCISNSSGRTPMF